MSRDVHNLVQRAHVIAKYGSPKDTGNLRFNAIKKKMLNSTTGVITFIASEAYYFWYLEQGKGHTSKHQGFLTRITDDIETMVREYFLAKEGVYSKYRSKALRGRTTKGELQRRRYRNEYSQNVFRKSQTAGG